MSPLHARIKFVECTLPIIYHLRSGQQSRKHASKKKKQKRIKGDFYNKFGLRVDIVKQDFGSSNNGNISRFFADSWQK